VKVMTMFAIVLHRDPACLTYFSSKQHLQPYKSLQLPSRLPLTQLGLSSE